MALEAVVYPQFQLNSTANKDPYNMFYDGLTNLDHIEYQDHYSIVDSFDFLGNQTESTTCFTESPSAIATPPDETAPALTRPKRRRCRSRKNKEDVENQRMTHITVERNRRKQMNNYLSALRSLMPDSYVQRGDQASIIGGAINYVKELEQQLQSLTVRKKTRNEEHFEKPFSEFFGFPQYSTLDETTPGTGDVEVTMVESHASLKIRSKRWPRQLVRLVSGLQSLRLTILHLNVTTEEEIVFYSLSVKVEDDCLLSSVDEIATAVYQILTTIHEETLSS